MTNRFSLGIDTGGTYTDAVVFSETDGVTAKAKALTTRHDLTLGIQGAGDLALASSGVDVSTISLVSLSTTLATNALVEGQGGRVALIMVGFEHQDLKRDGLSDALGNDPVIFLTGGHDVHGRETPLDLGPLQEWLDAESASVSAFAIAGYFAVRNPAHEQSVRELIRRETGKPVTCSHELSSKLGGPKRALTTLLNARLVGMIDRLISSSENYLKTRGINAPLMVVRGDGALISADEARLRPIETILSGPAASLVGAQHLTGQKNAVVSDIGGTTTDIAVLQDGRPYIDEHGARVGGFQTMVEAVAMRTFGLGGDSEVHLEETGLEAQLRLGPRRLIPISLLAKMFPRTVLPALEAQMRRTLLGRLDGRFALRTGLDANQATGLQNQEAVLYDQITDTPQTLENILSSQAQRATLDRLVARGLVHISGFTPSDAMHVLSRQLIWDRDAAVMAAELFARRKSGSGKPIAESAEDLSRLVLDCLTRTSGEAVLSACFAHDGASNIDPRTSHAVRRALDGLPSVARVSVSLDRPLVGLGASAQQYYPAIGSLLNCQCEVPADADVANAIGAVVGQVRIAVSVVVSSPEEGQFIVNGAGQSSRYRDEQQALQNAVAIARQSAVEEAVRNGVPDPAVAIAEAVEAPVIEGSRKFVEARITVEASGRPSVQTDER